MVSLSLQNNMRSHSRSASVESTYSWCPGILSHKMESPYREEGITFKVDCEHDESKGREVSDESV